MQVKLTPSTSREVTTSGVPVESERAFSPSSVVEGFHVPCVAGVCVVKVGVDVGIVEGMFVAVVVGAVEGFHVPCAVGVFVVKVGVDVGIVEGIFVGAVDGGAVGGGHPISLPPAP